MFKLFRDSIFAPKNIIHYRAKSGWFTFFYMMLVALIMGIVFMVKPISYTGLTYHEKRDIISAFKNTDSKIQSGIYYSTYEKEIEVNGITIGFYSTNNYVYNMENPPVFAVIGGSIYYVMSAASGNRLYLYEDISELPEKLQNINLYELDETSECFDEINNLISYYKPMVVALALLIGLIQGLISMLTYSLLTYGFMILMLRVDRFMKKGQLFKMLIFSSTAIVVTESLIELFGISGILIWLFLFVSFIPLFILEREITKRIKIKMFGDGVINNPSVMDKINEAIEKRENNNEEDNDVIDVKLDDDDLDNYDDNDNDDDE